MSAMKCVTCLEIESSNAAATAEGRRDGAGKGKTSTMGSCVAPGQVNDVSTRRIGRSFEGEYGCWWIMMVSSMSTS